MGYDTVAGYAPFASLVQRYGLGREASLLLQAHMAPGLWLLVGALASTRVNPFTLLEALPPLLYGFLGLVLWRFCQRGLGWDARRSGFAVLLVLAYFLPLRYRWDNLNDLLGVTLLLLALAEVPHFPPSIGNSSRTRASSTPSTGPTPMRLGSRAGCRRACSSRSSRWTASRCSPRRDQSYLLSRRCPVRERDRSRDPIRLPCKGKG